MEDATQIEEEPQKSVSKREAEMEAVILARQQEKEGDTAEIEDGVVEPVPDEDVLEFLGKNGEVYSVPKSARAKLKIDGKETEEEVEKIYRSYQKGAAGDKRLQEASEMMRQIAAKESALSEKEKAFQLQMEEAQEKLVEGDLSEDDFKKAIRDAADALVDADVEAAAELLSTVIRPKEKARKEPVIDFDKEIESRLEARDRKQAAKLRQEQILEANAKFESMDEYKSIRNNPDLLSEANEWTKILQATMINAHPWDIIETAAKKVLATTKKDQPTRKSPPTPVSGRSMIGKDEVPETREQAIANMKRTRGQPV